MLLEVKSIMNNQKALISLAYLKTVENPYEVFGAYIQYCLTTAPNMEMTHTDLCNKVNEVFALNIPQSIIKLCLKILANDDIVERLPYGNGYKIKNSSFDVSAFEARRDRLECEENALISSLCSFVKSYGQEWTQTQAKENLTYYLLNKEIAIDVFLKNPIGKEEKKVSPSWYIGKYIEKILEEDGDEKKYLLAAANGLMIFIGIFQFEDFRQQSHQKFKDTEFFVDTKLLLRILGYSWELEVMAAKEMIDLIRNEYEGKICVFEQTISEVVAALQDARNELRGKRQISDRELNFFQKTKKFEVDDFDIASSSIRTTITSLGFSIEKDVDWKDKDVIDNNIDVEGLTQFIKEKHPNWKTRAIENDAEAINKINILRKSDYSVSFGGRKHLPIFVTTNKALVFDVKEFVKEEPTNGKKRACWNNGKTPIISDEFLMCRLWLPKKSLKQTVPILTLSREAYAVQLADAAFIDKLSSNAAKVKEKHNVDVVDIPDYKRRKLEEIIVAKVGGNYDDIDEDIVASSFDEFVALETKRKDDIIDSKERIIEGKETKILALENDALSKQQEIDLKNERIAEYASERFVNKIGGYRFLLWICDYLWLIVAFVVFLASIAVSILVTIKSNNLSIWFTLFASPVIGLLGTIFDKASEKKSVKKFLIKKLLPLAKEKMENRIKNGLRDEERELEAAIVAISIEQTKIFRKYKDYEEQDSDRE